jgi:hypothetical protein
MNPELERKVPDFHMKGLAKSVCAKDAGEMTVVLLGYVTDLQKEAYELGRKEVNADAVELYEALEMMWEQYCPEPFTHQYMTAGENCEEVLQLHSKYKTNL